MAQEVPAIRHDGHGYPRQLSKSLDFSGLALPIELSDVNFAPRRDAEFTPLRKLEQPLREWWREPWAIPWGSGGPNYRGEQQGLAGKRIQQCLRMQEKIGPKGVRYD